jgi:hypothetical protein
MENIQRVLRRNMYIYKILNMYIYISWLYGPDRQDSDSMFILDCLRFPGSSFLEFWVVLQKQISTASYVFDFYVYIKVGSYVENALLGQTL